MNEEKAKKLAEDHWDFQERWLRMVFKDGMTHGYKHGYEDGYKHGREDAEENHRCH